MVEEVKIDTNLYSRQIGTFGLETMGKLVKMKVLIIGARGLGCEIAKNLILAGPKSVTLYDPTQVTIADQGANFYIKDSDIGTTTRAEASISQLGELNPYVQTSSIPEFTKEMIKDYSLICMTENFWGTMEMIAINEACRSQNVGFIVNEVMGVSGYAFLDYGPNFMVNDADGETTKQFIVSSIEQAENPVVHVHEDKRHTYQDGDFVKFVEVEGMTELNSAGNIEIFDAKAYSFKLRLNTSGFGAYTRQGVVEDVKVPKKVEFKSFMESGPNPAACTQFGMLEPLDMNYFGMGRSEQLHFAFGAVHFFRDEHGRYPGDNESDIAWCIAKAKEINTDKKAKELMCVDEVDE